MQRSDVVRGPKQEQVYFALVIMEEFLPESKTKEKIFNIYWNAKNNNSVLCS